MPTCLTNEGPNNRNCFKCGRTFHSSIHSRRIVSPDSPFNIWRRCFYALVRRGRIVTILHEPRIHDWNLPPDLDFPSMFRSEFN